MGKNTYYWLITDGEDPTLVYYYQNPDFHMNPEEEIKQGKDYSENGFGFNIADGGGFLPECDLKESTKVVKAVIEIPTA